MSTFPRTTVSYRLRDGTTSTIVPAFVKGITADNNTILFDSFSDKLVSPDSNVPVYPFLGEDVFQVNLSTGAVKLVDTEKNGSQLTTDTHAIQESNDGRYVLFEATRYSLLFRKDVQTGDLVPVSVNAAGNQVKYFDASMSADGRFVIWSAGDSAAVTSDTPAVGSGNDDQSVYLTDLDNGTTRRISKNQDGTPLIARSSDRIDYFDDLSLSADGRYAIVRLFVGPKTVSFDPEAPPYVPPAQDGFYRIDLATGAVLKLTSRADTGTGDSLSVDDNIFVYTRDLATSDPNAPLGTYRQEFALNISTGTNTLVSAAKNGTAGNGNSENPEVSADGRFVLFASYATNLGPTVYVSTAQGAVNRYLYIKDLLTGDVIAVEPNSATEGLDSGDYFFTPDGHKVVYRAYSQTSGKSSEYISDISSFIDRTVVTSNTGVGAGHSFTLQGDTEISATLTLTGDAANGAAVAKVVQGATLSGGGKIVLGNATGQDRPDLAKVVTDGNGAGLDLQGFSITGNGTIGDSHLTLQLSSGSISATSKSLVIDTGANVVANFGIFSAFGGTLKIRSDVDQSGGGAIVAYTGSNAWLGNVTIIGGSLKSFGTGLVEIVGDTLLDGRGASGEGVRVQGALTIDAGMTLEAIGLLYNAGTIKVAGNYFGANTTRLIFDNYATITGGGTILLTDTSGQNDEMQAIVTGDVDAAVVNVDNAITGYGLVGDGKLSLVNQSAGSIIASGGTLAIRTDGLDVINGGLIEARTGAITVAQGIDNAGTIRVGLGYTFTISGKLSNNGVAQIAGTLDVGSTTGGQEFAFTGTSALLRLHAESGTSSLTGFTAGDAINFVGQAGLATQVVNGTMKILSSAGTVLASFLLDSAEQQLVFSAASNGAGGTLLTANSSSNPSAGSGQTISGANVSSGQTLSVFSGGTGSGNIVSSGGQELVYSGGTATGDTISAGGILYAFSGGNTNGTNVASGGFAGALNGGAIVNATVLSNGIALARSGGTITSALVSSGGYVIAYGGVTVAASVLNGALEFLGQGGISQFAKLLSGGTQEVLSAGLASGTVMSLGSLQLILGSGSSMDARVSSGGTALLVNGFQSHTIVSNGGVDYVEGATGLAVNDVISSGGVEFVLAGGTASNTTISSGGLQIVSSGGTAAGTIVSNGGFEVVAAGGLASGGIVSGGVEYIQSGGVQSGGLDAAGGVTIVLGGGKAVGLTVGSNGVAVESSGGMGSNIIVSQGGYDVVLSGGTVSGATLISGGVLVVNSGASAAGQINFSGVNNEIIVASGGSIAGATLSGFTLGDYVDLKGLGYTSGVTHLGYVANGGNTGGTLTITSGAQAINLNLLGQYVAGNFTLANDGAGGTLVGDPPVSSGAIAAYVLKDRAYA